MSNQNQTLTELINNNKEKLTAKQIAYLKAIAKQLPLATVMELAKKMVAQATN